MSKWTNFTSTETNTDLDMVEDVSPDEIHAKKESLLLVDVRSKEEYHGELGHVSGSKLICLENLMDEIDNLPKDRTIVFICRSGRRSASATAMAKDSGFESVYNMKGGMLLWNDMGLDVQRDGE